MYMAQWKGLRRELCKLLGPNGEDLLESMGSPRAAECIAFHSLGGIVAGWAEVSFLRTALVCYSRKTL